MDNKCSWLINHALKLVTPEQRTLLEVKRLIFIFMNQNNYGRKDKDCESKVKQLFKDLNLPDVYQKYEEQSYSEIMNLIKKVDNMPQTIFVNMILYHLTVQIDFANRIYKRNK